MGLVVVKVGGSLFDLPDLRERLGCWSGATGPPLLLVPGGGPGADVIRQLDQVHQLGEERAHWLALRVLTVNAHFLAGLLSVPVVTGVGDVTRPIPPLAVLDPHAFCQADEWRAGSLPPCWQTTSDAVAARVAETTGARLVLLKSIDLPAGTPWRAAAEAGLVDQAMESVVARAGLRPEWVNLRSTEILRQ